MRTSLVASLFMLSLPRLASAEDQPLVDLTTIDRSIVREPDYVSEPHYILVVIGLQAEHRSWLVMDGNDILYFDRNGNGDLTDPEDRIAMDVEATNAINLAPGSAYSAMNVFPIGRVHGVELQFDFWVRAPGVVPDHELLRQFQREREENNWETGTIWRTAADGNRAQNGGLLTATPDEAQITHLNGPLTFALKWHDRQRLEPWPKYSVFDINIGTPGLPARNSTYNVFSPLTETEIPRDLHPLAIFQFPSRDGGAPIRQVVELDERCCGDTVLARMTVPRGAGVGNATVSLSYVAWTDESIAPAEFEVPIVTEPSDHAELSFVMFEDPEQKFDLESVQPALRDRGLSAQYSARDGIESLLIMIDGRPEFSIMLTRGDDVQETAQILGAGSPHAPTLNHCDSRFEIGIVYFGEVLEDGSILTQIQGALQQSTHGIIYNTWDKQLVGLE